MESTGPKSGSWSSTAPRAARSPSRSAKSSSSRSSLPPTHRPSLPPPPQPSTQPPTRLPRARLSKGRETGSCGKKLIWAIQSVCALSIFFFGYDQGMMGGVNGAPDYIQTMNLGYLTPSANGGKGGIVAAYYLGTLIGCLVGGWIGDKLGRKKTIWIGALWILVGAPLQAAAQNVAWMVMARIITGVGTGHLNVIVPVWSAETSGHLSRGFFIALEFTLNIFGVVVAYWLEYGLSFVGDGNTQIRWRFPIAFQPV